MLTIESLAAAEALEELQRQLREAEQYERDLARQRKEWIDRDTLRDIIGADSDTERHFSGPLSGEHDLDDIRYAIRAELGRDFDTASMRIVDEDPEHWYECGDETWEPEEPVVLPDVVIHRMAVAKHREELERAFMRPGMRARRTRKRQTRKRLSEAVIEYLAGGER